MATSESEDFESADEDFEPEKSKSENIKNVESEKPDDGALSCHTGPVTAEDSKFSSTSENDNNVSGDITVSTTEIKDLNDHETDDLVEQKIEPKQTEPEEPSITSQDDVKTPNTELSEQQTSSNVSTDVDEEKRPTTSKLRREQQIKQREQRISSSKAGAKKLGARISNPPNELVSVSQEDQEKETTNISKIETTDLKNKNQLYSDSLIDNKSGEDISKIADKLAALDVESRPAGSWGWTGWGSSLLSTATASVSTLTSHVSQGISTVIETVESGLGAPDPEELARQDLVAAMEKEKIFSSMKEPLPEDEQPVTVTPDTSNNDAGGSLFPLGQIFSGVSQLGKIVENTSAKVLSGGLDTLEVIGKKTMEVLQEGDPGLKKKRAIFQPDRPILSQVLRDAKNQADEEAKLQEEKQAAKKVHFETLFDDYQGLIHLEALEMLSRQCEMKLQAALLDLNGPALQSIQSCLQSVRDECLLPDPDDIPDEIQRDFEMTLNASFAALSLSISADRIIKVWKEVQSNCTKPVPHSTDDTDESSTAKELTLLHEQAVSSLAHLTASCVEQFHRTGELLLVNEPRDPQKEAAQLVQITLLESAMIEQLATQICEALNIFGEPAQPIITKVFLEASNSSTYIQDAFQLLVPVLQVGVL